MAVAAAVIVAAATVAAKVVTYQPSLHALWRLLGFCPLYAAHDRVHSEIFGIVQWVLATAPGLWQRMIIATVRYTVKVCLTILHDGSYCEIESQRSKDPITAPGLLLLTMKDFWNTDTNQIIGNFLRINPQVFNIPQQQKISFSLLAVATRNTKLQVASCKYSSPKFSHKQFQPITSNTSTVGPRFPLCLCPRLPI